MVRAAIVVGAFLGAAGCCGARQPVSPDPPSAAADGENPARPGEEAEPETRYRVGDAIAYLYAGSFTEVPVRMDERVVGQEGNRLRIEVTLTRGDETRQWIQVVTDTEENQRNNVLDELWEIVDGEPRRLANEGNADILRLVDWTLLSGMGPLRDALTEEATLEIAGESYDCLRESSTTEWQGRTLRFVRHVCEDFLWTNGPATFVDPETNETIWAVEVLEVTAPR